MASDSFTITLPARLAAYVTDRVADGSYANPSAVVNDALDLLFADDVLSRRGLEDEARAAFAAYQADPTNVMTSEELLAYLNASRETALAAE